MRFSEVARDALTGVVRQPGRTVLCMTGTVVAVAALVTTNGLTHSAQGAVAASFNLLQATTVEFQARDTLLTEPGVDRLDRLNGVRSVGLLWDINNDQQVAVATTPQALSIAPSGAPSSGSGDLVFTVATPSALRTIGARVSVGRLYDEGADRQRQMVALLGEAAAQRLGISSTVGSPAIFVGQSALTVIGIIRSTQQENQVLLGVVVPPYVASVISGRSGERRVIARTAPGAAQLVGKQGPYALAPDEPSEVAAEVPPDPSTLRQHVEASLSALLFVLAVVGVAVGFLSITAVTMLSVIQRRAEIGLRRAIGYQRWDIARLILAETTCIGILGAIVGLSVGVLATSTIAASRSWIPVMDPEAMVLAPLVLVGIAIGVVAGMYPAVMAMRTTPLAALRSG